MHRRCSRRRMFLGHAGSDPQAARHHLDPCGLHWAAIFRTPRIVITARMPRDRIVFDPTVTSYRHILEFFFQIHDPTTLNRQAMIVALHRSGIYYVDEERSASPRIRSPMLDASGLWDGKVVTEVQPVGEFWGPSPITGLSGEAAGRLHLPLRPSRLGFFQSGMRPAMNPRPGLQRNRLRCR